MSKSGDWFSVDKEGLYKILKRKGMQFLIYELVQNAWDTRSGMVQLGLVPVDGRPMVDLVVTDEDPDGFKDLAHAYTLFAESEKKGDPSKRGRFNLGEKMVLAACTEATITSTQGTVMFGPDGRRTSRKRRSAGTEFRAQVRMTREELASVLEETRKLLPPVPTIVNGVELPTRKAMRRFEAVLATDIADEEGILRRTKRKTEVRVYQGTDAGPRYLYELGIPVLEQDLPWDIEIMQKVPLNTERDNVTPAFLRDVHVAVLNAMHTYLKPEEASLPAVQEALEDDDIGGAAVSTVLTHMFGKDRAVHDPSDTEAGHRLTAKGFKVIHGGSFSKAAWANIKRHEAALPAGQISPSPQPYSTDPNAPERKLIPESDWTHGMRNIAEYATECARRFIGREITVCFDVGRWNAWWLACYGDRELTFNYGKLRKDWFEQGPTQAVNDVLIHELAHEFGGHLTEEFDHALSRIGSRMVEAALTEPGFFAKYRRDAVPQPSNAAEHDRTPGPANGSSTNRELGQA